MKSIISACLFFVFLASANAEKKQVLIKEQLKTELLALQKDLDSLGKTIDHLKKDKYTLNTQLEHMQEWGNAQQEEKMQYFDLADNYKKVLLSTENNLINEKKEKTVLLEKYRKIKTILAFAGGLLLVLVYTRFGSSLVSMIAGPYTYLLYFIGPVVVFMLGFGTIYLYF